MHETELQDLFAKLAAAEGSDFVPQPQVRCDGLKLKPTELLGLSKPQQVKVEELLQAAEPHTLLFQNQGHTFCVTPIERNGARGYNIRQIFSGAAHHDDSDSNEDSVDETSPSWFGSPLLAVLVIGLLLLGAVAVVMPGAYALAIQYMTLPANEAVETEEQQFRREWREQTAILQAAAADLKQQQASIKADKENLKKERDENSRQLGELVAKLETQQNKLAATQKNLESAHLWFDFSLASLAAREFEVAQREAREREARSRETGTAGTHQLGAGTQSQGQRLHSNTNATTNSLNGAGQSLVIPGGRTPAGGSAFPQTYGRKP